MLPSAHGCTLTGGPGKCIKGWGDSRYGRAEYWTWNWRWNVASTLARTGRHAVRRRLKSHKWRGSWPRSMSVHYTSQPVPGEQDALAGMSRTSKCEACLYYPHYCEGSVTP
jgi:hypothetical protein